MKHTFQVFDKKIKYSIKRSSRRKTIQIAVKPSREIIISTPQSATVKEVEQLLEKKQPWLYKTLLNIEDLPPPIPPRKYINGETHYYLGNQHRLNLSYGKKNIALRKTDNYYFFDISTPNPDNPEAIARQLKQWYRKQAKIFFAEELKKLTYQTRNILELSEDDIIIKVRSMKKRWGSCNGKNTINLNLELIKTPADCIEYVLIHELCHFKQMNHSKEFWNLVTFCMPEWKEYKRKLDSFPVEL